MKTTQRVFQPVFPYTTIGNTKNSIELDKRKNNNLNLSDDKKKHKMNRSFLTLLCFFIIHISAAQKKIDVRINENDEGIIEFELINNKKRSNKNLFFECHSYIIIDGTKYNLGEEDVFLSLYEFEKHNYTDSLAHYLLSFANPENINWNTKLFKNSSSKDTVSHTVINHGGQIFHRTGTDTIIIAYNVRGAFAYLGDSAKNNLFFSRVHCFCQNTEHTRYNYVVPLRISEYRRLRKKQIIELGLKRSGLTKYNFIPCD